MKARKGQSATEYLMTYGWAILAIVVVIGCLWNMGLFGGEHLEVIPEAGYLQLWTDEWEEVCYNETFNGIGHRLLYNMSEADMELCEDIATYHILTTPLFETDRISWSEVIEECTEQVGTPYIEEYNKTVCIEWMLVKKTQP